MNLSVENKLSRPALKKLPSHMNQEMLNQTHHVIQSATL